MSYNRRSSLLTALAAGVCLVILALVVGRTTYVATDALLQNTVGQLAEATAQSAGLVSQRIGEEMAGLRRLSAALSALGWPDQAGAALQSTASKGASGLLVAVGPDGQGVAGQDQVGAVGQALFQQVLAGEEVIAAGGSSVPGDRSLVLLVPIRQLDGDGVVGAVGLLYGGAALDQLMGPPSYRNSSQRCVLDGSGALVSWTGTAAPDFAPEGRFGDAALLEREPELAQLRQDMDKGLGGALVYRPEGGAESCLAYAPMGTGGWYMLDQVEPDAVDGAKQALRRVVVTVVGVSAALLGAVFAVLFFYERGQFKRRQSAALSDPLTALPNLRHMQQFYEELPSHVDRAFLMFRITNFDRANEIFGSAVAAQFLREASAMLAAALEPDELAARISEACFGLLFHDKGGRQAIARRIDELFTKLRRIPLTDGTTIYDYPCSIVGGVYMLREKDEAFSSVSRKARAMMEAQRARPDLTFSWGWLDQRFENKLSVQDTLSTEIVRAISNGEFIPYFQPQYNVMTKEIVGAELLARWDHPTQGLLMPGLFLPMLEAAGCALELDLIMVEQACRMIRGWLEQGLLPVPLSVNLSRLNVHREDFLQRLLAITRQYQIPTNLISLELSERAITDNSEKALTLARRLKAEGFMVSMDNFGTGASSLALLWDLPVDVVKLDRAFLFCSGSATRRRSILHHTVAMAHGLGLWLIAEGVETEEQAEEIKAAGCRLMQGYLFSQPLSEQDFAQLIFADSEGLRIGGDIFSLDPVNTHPD